MSFLSIFVYRIAKICVYNRMAAIIIFLFFVFCGLEFAGHSFAYAAHFLFLRTQRAAGASRRANTLTTHLPNYKIILYVHCIRTQL